MRIHRRIGVEAVSWAAPAKRGRGSVRDSLLAPVTLRVQRSGPPDRCGACGAILTRTSCGSRKERDISGGGWCWRDSSGGPLQRELDRSAVALARLDAHRLAVQIHDPLHDGKPETGPVTIGVVRCAIEAVEDSWQVLRLDSASGVDYAHADERRCDQHLCAHMSPRGRISQGVLE